MNDSKEDCIFYNPPGTSHTEKHNGAYPDEENINLGMFIKGRRVRGGKYGDDFLVPGMTGFDEARALIQLAGVPERDYLKLRVTWGELRAVLSNAGVDVSQLVTW